MLLSINYIMRMRNFALCACGKLLLISCFACVCVWVDYNLKIHNIISRAVKYIFLLSSI